MASIKQSLKKVYKSLSGGKESKAKNISSIIDDISTVTSSGGGSDFNGVFLVPFIKDSNFNYTIDIGFNDVVDAYENGKKIIGITTDVDSKGVAIGFTIIGDVTAKRAASTAPITAFDFKHDEMMTPDGSEQIAYLIKNQIVFDSAGSINVTTKVYSFSVTPVQ